MKSEILKKYNIKAKKSLGQNFLVDEFILDEIGNIVEVSGNNIVEVGPGYGALTEKLLTKKPKSLTLVELDKDMVDILESRIEKEEFNISGIDFEIQNIDVLKYVSDKKKYSVIANIPYYITSPILRHFLYDVENKPESMVILMQKDVGDKILLGGNESISGQTHRSAPTGNNVGVNLCVHPDIQNINQNKKIKSSVLSLFIAKKCYVSQKVYVPKESFVPAPKIESSVLLFKIHNLYKNIDDEKFLKIIKIGFNEPRKKLIKNLIKGGYSRENVLDVFENLGLEEGVRGDSLGVDVWCEIIKSFDM